MTRSWPVFALIAACLSGCGEAPMPPAHLRIAGGIPDQGRALIHRYGCGTCHAIAGIRGARGTVGPVLDDYARRNLVAGILPNTPATLISWIVNPVALDPRTGMPTMGVTEQEARHMAAYLYTLGAEQAVVYPNGPPLDLEGREQPAPIARGTPLAGPDSGDPPRSRPR